MMIVRLFNELFYSILSLFIVQSENMSSIKRFQTRGFNSLWLRISVSTLFMNILEKATAISVPMAVHAFERSNFCEIPFLHLAQQTSSQFALKYPCYFHLKVKSVLSTSIFLSTGRKKPV